GGSGGGPGRNGDAGGAAPGGELNGRVVPAAVRGEGQGESDHHIHRVTASQSDLEAGLLQWIGGIGNSGNIETQRRRGRQPDRHRETSGGAGGGRVLHGHHDGGGARRRRGSRNRACRRHAQAGRQ